MSEAILALDSTLELLAASVDQDIVSPRTLKFLAYLIIFIFAVLGITMKKKPRLKMTLQTTKKLVLCSCIDGSFVLLGALLDYLAIWIGKRRFCFTVLLVPTGNRFGIIQGLLVDMLLSPPNTCLVFRLAFFLPSVLAPAIMLLGDDPINELLVDPVWAGVPLLTYMFGAWVSNDHQGVLALASGVWEYRYLVLYISGSIWWNHDLIFSAFGGVLWICRKAILLIWTFSLEPPLQLLGATIAARLRQKKAYSDVYSAPTQPYQYRPLHDTHIRLLRLWARGPADGICCEIVGISLDEAQSQSYEAISYTWGATTKTHSIILNGQEMRVTKHVYNLLCDHSSSWRSKYLWIDSICINQDNNQEKNKQVLLMNMIYRRASRVLVYLGNDPDSHLAIGLLKELKVLTEYNPSGQDVYLQYESERTSPRWTALIKMLSHEWFERIWIIQEVVVASNVVVRYGGKFIAWKTLIAAVRLLASDEARLLTLFNEGDLETRKSALAKLSHIELLARSREDFERGKTSSFQEVMFRYSTFKATDNRDKVYGLLGCVSNAGNLPKDVLPDYSKTVAQVYTATADFLLSPEMSPSELLAHAGIGWNRNIKGLPSWVPDWTSVDGPCTLGGPKCGYRASRSLPFIIQTGCIPESKIIGVVIGDTIEKMGSVNRYPSGKQPASPDSCSMNSSVKGSVNKDSVIQNKLFIKWIEETIELTRNYASRYGPSPEQLDEEVWRTLIGDMKPFQAEPAGAEYGEAFRNWKVVYEILEEFEDKFSEVTSSGPGADLLEKELRDRIGEDGARKFNKFHQSMKWATKAQIVSGFRKFCVTQFGYVGLVPLNSEPGDFIAVIAGIKTPYVLRLNNTEEEGYICNGQSYPERTYSIVGECYIHGIMDGQLLDPQYLAPCTII